MGNVILCNLSDANYIIEEERFYWISDVLDALSVPEEVYDSKTIDEFRDKMDDFGIEVELSTDGSVKVYKKQWYEDGEENVGWLPATKDHLVAQWNEPTRVKRVEGKEVYYEIHLNEWSILNMRRS